MDSWFDIKVRGMMGDDESDTKEIVILNRIVKWTKLGIEYEADPKHRRIILEYFGLDRDSRRVLSSNGDKEDKWEPGDDEVLDRGEAKLFRGMAARLNFLSLDCPNLQFAVKQCSKEMSRPVRGSWKRLKKVARYLVGVEKVVWEFAFQDEARYCWVCSDSDWGGDRKDRKSTSGGVWMLGDHCIKTWSATQGPYALSSAEAEFYAMVP
jgi:hypothetical protein